MILLTNTTPASLRSAFPSSAEEGNLRTRPLPNFQKLKVVMISVVRLLASDRNVPGKPPESAFERPNSGELMFPIIGPGFV